MNFKDTEEIGSKEDTCPTSQNCVKYRNTAKILPVFLEFTV